MYAQITCSSRPTVETVVGVQPFGGENLSGTGPKAINTTAAGGNASLLTLGE